MIKISKEQENLIQRVDEPKNGLVKQAWQYPYDIEFNIISHSKDVVFWPVNFPQDNLKDCIYYKGKFMGEDAYVELKLVKRLEDFGIEQHRTISLLLCVTIFIGALIVLPFALKSWIYDYMALDEYYGTNANAMNLFGSVFLSILALLGSLVVFKDKISYYGMFKEAEMEKEYYINSRGEFVG